MSKVFRAKYVAALKSRLPEVDKQLVNSLFKKEWVVQPVGFCDTNQFLNLLLRNIFPFPDFNYFSLLVASC
jgi:hypothetical protein